MKIVIADYPDVLGRELEKEFAFLREDIPDAEIGTRRCFTGKWRTRTAC